jgi:hypothetical protein
MEELCGMLGVEMQDLHGAVPLLKEKEIRQTKRG